MPHKSNPESHHQQMFDDYRFGCLFIWDSCVSQLENAKNPTSSECWQ